MFWRGNYTVTNDVNFLLKGENVTLTQVLEADDILQECRADNKALSQFLTKAEIRAELITLITEEPTKNMELTTQYRHSSIASEVLTSQLPTLRDSLAMDPVQMNRLCDFVNKDPPLNPLLASYFSKTISMLFERSPKQDWYAHNIICLHVLDCFKSRRDFLPNLLMHMSTSAICDVFKCFMYLQDPFNKIILEWFDEHELLENFIQVICGTYEPLINEPLPVNNEPGRNFNDKVDSNHNDSQPQNGAEPDKNLNDLSVESDGEMKRKEINYVAIKENEVQQEKKKDENINKPNTGKDTQKKLDRIRHVASANAAALLCEITLYSNNLETWQLDTMSWTNTGAGAKLCARLRSEEEVGALLVAVFTAPTQTSRSALIHASSLLEALLAPPNASACDRVKEDLISVERAVAPHLPLFHYVLLRPPRQPSVLMTEIQGEQHEDEKGLGMARVSVAGIMALLARSELYDVVMALLGIGTAGILVEMFFQYPENNFMHAQVLAFVRNAINNRHHRKVYVDHLIEECHLLTRLMDAFEENETQATVTENRKSRAGYMGHAILMLRVLDEARIEAGPRDQERWAQFREERLRPLVQRFDIPLGGVHPSDNEYAAESAVHQGGGYGLGEIQEGTEAEEILASNWTAEEPLELRNLEDANSDLEYTVSNAEMTFSQMVDQRYVELWGEDATMGDGDIEHQVLADVSPWDCCDNANGGLGSDAGEAGWAQFGDAFATSDWPETDKRDGLENAMSGMPEEERLQHDHALTVELAQKMLTAINSLGGDAAAAAEPSPLIGANPTDSAAQHDQTPPPPAEHPAER